MCSHKIDHQHANELIEVLRLRINRFYSEGFVSWSKSQLAVELDGAIDLEDSDLQAALQDWDRNGAIKLHREESLYLEVLTAIQSSNE